MEASTSLRPFHRVIFALGCITAAVYAVAVLLALGYFRSDIRARILQRDGILLTSVAQYLYDTEGAPADELDLLNLALEASEIRGVIGVRLYAPLDIAPLCVPATLKPAALAPADQHELAAGRPVTRYSPALRLDQLFSDATGPAAAPVPLTEVIVPVRDKGDVTIAAIQYWLDGAVVDAEFARLDRLLAALGGGFLGAGSLIFLSVFLYARHRLLRMGRLLAERNRALEKLNADLALAARAAAVGSIIGHLFHGLKSPLAGLKAYLRATTGDEEAVALTSRMQSLIDETLTVLRQEDTDFGVELTLDELVAGARRRFATAAGPAVQVTGSGQGSISARKAQLALLVLRNLVDNAREASPPDATVRVELTLQDGALRAEVSDRGPGLPEYVRARLFQPVQSGKSNGTGIGLAISAAIARHIPATLELRQTGAHGTSFVLHVPLL